MQESPDVSLSKAAHHRLIETINSVSELATKSGMTVVYAHRDPGRLTAKTLSNLGTKRLGSNRATPVSAAVGNCRR